jgi:hypothetical protein
MPDKLNIFRFESCSDFFTLIDELRNEFERDERSFYYSRDVILKHFMEGNLYGLELKEITEKKRKQLALSDFGDGIRVYGLPCFCIIDDGVIKFLWMAERIRGKGYAKFMVRKLKPVGASSVLEESRGFWLRMGVPEI